MIYSMTGYANKTVQVNNTSLVMELRSVNQRFFDLTIKTNEEFKHLESALRSQLMKKVTRGKLDLKIFIHNEKESSSNVILNHEALKQYLLIGKQIQDMTDQPASLSVAEIMALPGVLSQGSLDIANIEPAILENMNDLIAQFSNSQQIEGGKIAEVILERLHKMSAIIDEAKEILPQISEAYKQKIINKLKEVISENDINDVRFQQEFTYFCQKIDVMEELDRLSMHVSEITKIIKNGGQIGKKLDFITQELLREANTFGSKSASNKTTSLAVDLKVLIEQIREQIQNIM